jgi:hypothetical protein
MDGTLQKIKSDPSPPLFPHIPFFSPIRRLSEPEAIIPLFHYSRGYLPAKATSLSEL